jgi:hypothetical protein
MQSGCWPASRHHATDPAGSPRGLCGKQGGRRRELGMAASRSVSVPCLSAEGTCLDPAATPPTAKCCKCPQFWTGKQSLGQQRARQRQQTVAAATLGVILTWFVLGQMPELNGLLVLSEQNPVYFEASVTRETAGRVAQQPASGIRGCRMKGGSFLFCHLAFPHRV